MINEKIHVSLFDMIMSLSKAIDLVNPHVHNHHKRVAYISYGIAEEMGLPKEEQRDILLAGALHDVGALFFREEDAGLKFEIDHPQEHAEMGYYYLQEFEPFNRIAHLVRYHHVYWRGGQGRQYGENPVSLGSHILHLSDRIEVLIDKKRDILSQAQEICNVMERYSGEMFSPQLVEVFLRLAKKESFWLDIVSPSIRPVLAKRARLATVELDLEGLLSLSKLYSKIIDFRSRFTAIHSSGVAASAEALASLVGWSKQECLMMRIAGYLHDLGKLAVPIGILEKPSSLTLEDMNIIKTHTFYTSQILEPISGMDTITTWAAFHHERLDGHGYPFHHNRDGLCLGARIMAVADVFTAITEDRPYRKGMDSEAALRVLENMSESGALDGKLVKIVSDNYDSLNLIRSRSQLEAAKDYQEFAQALCAISK